MRHDLAGLPLFDWGRDRCTVVAFPPSRRIRLARETAAKLMAEKDGRALAEAVRLVKDDLRAAGYITDSETWPLVWCFYETVMAEIDDHHRGDVPASSRR